jgi:isopentenyl-diphosphate delta-isomerase
MPNVILVDEQDNETGTAPKLKAHREGKLHRAFSIFVFNSRGQMLIQQRAGDKYHSGGLWTNTCCSHPQPGEAVIEAAHRRLQEEMGFDCELSEIFSFIYQVDFDNGLKENEFDHVLVGVYDQDPILNPEEAAAFAWVEPNELVQGMQAQPDRYTYWLKECCIRRHPGAYLKYKQGDADASD